MIEQSHGRAGRILLFLFCCVLALTPSSYSLQVQPQKATEALTVRHLPNPSEGHLWQHPQRRWITYRWLYRTEVKNNLDVPLQITRYGFHGDETATSVDFSEWYDDGDSTVDGWILPGKVAVNAENWIWWWPPVREPFKWSYIAKDSSGNVYHAEEEIGLTPVLYRYHAGDDTAWAKPEFDDNGWEQIKPWDFPNDRWQGVGWFRSVLKVDSTLWDEPLGLHIDGIFGAAEFYLDGKLIHRVGKIAATKEEEDAKIMLDAVSISFHPPPGYTRGKSRHLVAIRYSRFFFESPNWWGQRETLSWHIVDLQQMSADRANRIRNVTFHQMLLTGVFLAFALLHLLLFLFYPRSRANLYFTALTTCFALLIYFWFQFLFITDAVHYVWHLRLRNAALTLTTVSALRLTYLLLYPKLPKIFTAFFLVGIGLTLLNWFRPFIITDTYLFVFAIAVFPEILRVLVASRFKKREERLEGSWIILLGIIPFSLVGVYYLLIGLNVVPLPLPWEFEDFPTPFYAMLIVMISISVFLSRNFALTNKNLEAQLIQVRELSDKTVQQEREKAQLEAENARKSKELEEARKLQLSMLPQILPDVPHLEIAAFSKPATEVGGDYYDFHLDGDGRLLVVIGDAAGHGMKAGTMVSITKGLFKSLVHEEILPVILKKISAAIGSMNLSPLFMALTLVQIKDRRLWISAAGMPSALLYKAGTKSLEETTVRGLPLGLAGSSHVPYKIEEKELLPGDTLVLMSDGLPERFNDKSEILDYPVAKRLVEGVASESPEFIIEHLVKAGDQWANGRPQDDDVTFVVLKVKA